MAKQQSDDARGASRFLFLGNRLWLDFLNTHIKQDGEWVDLLDRFADLVHWLVEARVLDDIEAQEALRRWPNSPEQAQILAQARSFRAVLRAAVENITRAQPITGEVVSAINGILRNHCRSLELTFAGDKLTSQYVGAITEPLHLLAPIAESAAQALSGDDIALTRKCENPTCVLHFHDTTKNHTRRWCSMETCGNRMKAAAHYARVRVKEDETENPSATAGDAKPPS